MISLSAIETIVREARNKDLVVIVDEAYADYMRQSDSAVNLINKYNNLENRLWDIISGAQCPF